jgi:hypothetical protein
MNLNLYHRHGARCSRGYAPFSQAYESDEVEAHIQYMLKRVLWISADNDNAGWKAVVALASALLPRKVLTFPEASEVINPLLFPGSSLRQAA